MALISSAAQMIFCQICEKCCIIATGAVCVCVSCTAKPTTTKNCLDSIVNQSTVNSVAAAQQQRN